MDKRLFHDGMPWLLVLCVALLGVEGCLFDSAEPSNPLLYEFRDASCGGENCPDVQIRRSALPTQLKADVRDAITRDMNQIVLTVPFEGQPLHNWEEALASYNAFHREQPEAPLHVKGAEELVFLGKSFVSMSYTVETYTGGAHGITTRTLRSYLADSGARIALDDILDPAKREILATIAETEFRSQRSLPADKDLGSLGFFESTNGKFFLSDDFAIVREGLVFRYNPYEIAAFSEGSTEILLPKEGLKPVFKTDLKSIETWLTE